MGSELLVCLITCAAITVVAAAAVAWFTRQCRPPYVLCDCADRGLPPAPDVLPTEYGWYCGRCHGRLTSGH